MAFASRRRDCRVEGSAGSSEATKIVPFPPGSLNFAAGGKIELAHHRIRQPAAELRNTEQRGEGKVEYGVRLLEHLSEDLQRKLGSRFSKRNLYEMREFYLAYSILPAPAKLILPIIEFRGE